MKFSSVALLLFPLAILANPIALPEPAAEAEPESSPNPSNEAASLLSARDHVCHIITSGAQGCDWDPYNGSRRTTVQPGMTFGVSCYITDGRAVSGYRKWDYVPGWGCWISAKWTNSGCETGLRHPC